MSVKKGERVNTVKCKYKQLNQVKNIKLHSHIFLNVEMMSNMKLTAKVYNRRACIINYEIHKLLSIYINKSSNIETETKDHVKLKIGIVKNGTVKE